MTARYRAFDPSGVRLLPLAERTNDLEGDFILPLAAPQAPPPKDLEVNALRSVAEAMHAAKAAKANVIFMCGGHVIRSGVQRYIFDMMEQGHIQGIAVNGSVAIHDFEIALQNATTESVARYISKGQFGLWTETGFINDIVREGVADGLGFGEALGRELAHGRYPHKDKSLFSTAWELGVPVTVHLGIGYDIIHPHPNCDGAVMGAASYRDFLIFAQLLTGLENGVLGAFGSAVMAPEVFLKAFSMVRNVLMQEGHNIRHFTTLVCDLLDIPNRATQEASKSDPRYYFRPWKTLLARTVADGGQSFYVRGKHADTIPWLWQALENGKNDERGV